jgi:hypothetical protein
LHVTSDPNGSILPIRLVENPLLIILHPALDSLTAKTNEAILTMFANKFQFPREEFSRSMLQWRRFVEE